ncbi:MAG: metallophosphoesterase [Pseudomonadota bacterium]
MAHRTAIIGDVHGLLTPLQRLVGRLSLGPADQLIFVGDLVDKGPAPAETVDFAASLWESADYDVVLVEGNHEDRHRRYRRNLTVRPKIAAEQAGSAGELPGLTAELSERARAFLDSAVPFLRVEPQGILIVHGGIPGSMDVFPESAEAFAALTGKPRQRMSKILRTRFIDKDTGDFLAQGKEKPGDPFWADVYDGRFGHVVFGHQPFLSGPAEFPHATGIDTGAVHGGTLTALVLDGDARHYVQVPGIEVVAPKQPSDYSPAAG